MENKPTIQPSGRFKLRYRGVNCLNCGHPLELSDKYCPNCSQANSTKKLTLVDFFEEFLANYLSYDSKLWRTLAALLLRPGKITNEYISGKRLSYTNPFRFLLSLAIIYFLIISFNSEFESFNKFGSGNNSPIFNLDTELNKLEFDSEQEKQIALAQLDSLKIKRFITNGISQRDSTLLSNPELYFQKIDSGGIAERFAEKIQFFSTVIKHDTINYFEQGVTKFNLPKAKENEMAFNLANSLSDIERRPGSFLNSLISKLPITTFFFLPFFSFFIWMVYIRKKYTYTDHLIFSFHNQSLLFILLIVSNLINALFNIGSEGLFILIFAIYLYKAMRNFYQQGRVKTVIKYFLLNTIFFILGGIAITILIAASVFTY
ncbi:DUF3667 domain-containing protein [Maribacter stanieri]|uniref:DUF3667 domain-containing protein n=1 Tax=Maribacter stanieri TaxID=440514 RepID=A0A1I6KFD0_9FLAO|nr:DUF3667 domain-containing protein [Maribacter stanieri]SFR89590.1 Protein of unknown function [Maribacter stanieri]|tara:strand:- start:1898 stop:3022 length:1125 start_codon:yes stop_codon:yes gene_type:complete